jgi:indolepyruvate ferredoxin oxidoreductase beta subunit
MKTDIILAGVGGQGILSIVAVLGLAAMNSGLHVKQAEVHGMSQRGGAVQSHLRISDTAIHSDLVPRGAANIILSVEPLESLRYLEYLAPEGRLVTNTTPERNIPDYPEIAAVLAAIGDVPGSITIDANEVATAANNRRGMNMVMAGAASPFLSVSNDALTDAVRHVFARKGEAIIAANIAALEAGRSYVAARIPTAGERR